MKNFIRCRNCAIFGQTRTLGEILPDGNIAIKRVDAFNARIDYTILLGTHYLLQCGNCQTGVEITIERREDESLNYGTQWIFRGKFDNQVAANGMGNGRDSSQSLGTN